jgi:glucose-1-phosphate thymidylyltransferase
VLGNNIFYGAGLQKLLKESVRKVEEERQAVVFGYYVEDPDCYGVAEFNKEGKVLSIEEKPTAQNPIMQ